MWTSMLGPMIESSRLLSVYDERLRTAAEMTGATAVHRLGPLWIGSFPGPRLFVSYRDLGDIDEDGASALAARLVSLLHALAAELPADAGAGSEPGASSVEVEVKTRGHDRAPGWIEALTAAGFIAQEPESIMLGPVSGLLGPRPPAGVTVRRADTLRELSRAAAVADAVFGGSRGADLVPELYARLRAGEPVQQWIAEEAGEVVSTGRIDVVVGTGVAGIWGGATLPSHRHRGIYRALTAARAQAVAAEYAVEWIHSDSTEDSRPVLEASGLTRIGTTTPYVLHLPRR